MILFVYEVDPIGVLALILSIIGLFYTYYRTRISEKQKISENYYKLISVINEIEINLSGNIRKIDNMRNRKFSPLKNNTQMISKADDNVSENKNLKKRLDMVLQELKAKKLNLRLTEIHEKESDVKLIKNLTDEATKITDKIVEDCNKEMNNRVSQ